MRILKTIILFVSILMLTNCTSHYKMIEPKSINYNSSKEINNVKLEYRYNLLDKKYAKKEIKKGETKFGLIGIKANYYDSLTLKIE